MREFVIETRVPMAARRYAALAFTPAFDLEAMRDVARVQEHGAAEAAWRDRVLAHVATHHATPELHAWRESVRAPRAAESVLVMLAGAPGDAPPSTRFFRVTPVSRVVSMLAWALWHAGVAPDGVHYDAAQWRCADSTAIASLRFVLTAEALPSLVVEGCVHFEEESAHWTLQRVHLAVTTGSWMLDAAVAPFVSSVVGPDFERMASAAAVFAARPE